MSSSCPKRARHRVRAIFMDQALLYFADVTSVALLARRSWYCAGVVLLLSAQAQGAEVYVQPIASLATAYNSNVELAVPPAPRTSAVSYYADASSVIGVATPTSETTILPRLLYNYYPTQHDLDRLEGFLSLNSHFSWQRDRLSLIGYYDHRNDLNAEQPGAQYNTVTPGVGGTTSTSGRVALGTVRDFLEFQPNYAHYLTPLSLVGVAAEYQRAHFTPDDPSGHVDYNYYLGRGYYTYTVSPRLETTFSRVRIALCCRKYRINI